MCEQIRIQLHLDRIRALARQLENPATALNFLETYLEMLPDRIDRIHQGIADQDHEASHDAVLSLKVTSSMSGALSVEACCLELEPLLLERRFDLARVTAGRLDSEVTALHKAAPQLILNAHEHLHGIAA